MRDISSEEIYALDVDLPWSDSWRHPKFAACRRFTLDLRFPWTFPTGDLKRSPRYSLATRVNSSGCALIISVNVTNTYSPEVPLWYPLNTKEFLRAGGNLFRSGAQRLDTNPVVW